MREGFRAWGWSVGRTGGATEKWGREGGRGWQAIEKGTTERLDEFRKSIGGFARATGDGKDGWVREGNSASARLSLIGHWGEVTR